MKITPSFWRPRPRKGARCTFQPRLERLESRITPTGSHDTLGTAIPVTLVDQTAVPTSGAALADANQVDLYKIAPVQAGDAIVVDVKAMNDTGPGDTLRVFDGAGKQLAFQSAGAGEAARTFYALANGPYYVGVSSNGDNNYDPNAPNTDSGGQGTGPYTLTLTLNSSVILTPENPPNFTIATAQQISGNVDQSITGDRVLQGSYVSGETAYYHFAAPQGELTAAVAPAPGAAFLPRLALYDNKGQLLIQADASSTNASAQLDQDLAAGTFYLGVSAVTGSDAQSYLLTTTFTPASPPFQPLPVGFQPEGMAYADFNHDGNQDLVTADSPSNAVAVLLGNGDGTFQPGSLHSVSDANGVGSYPVAVATADLNGDGNMDIVTANATPNLTTGVFGAGTVSVLLGNGDGTFQQAVTYPVEINPDSVAVGDFNGHPGIVTANGGSNTVSVLLFDGSGNLLSNTAYPVGNFPYAVAVGDFNGHPDIVTANRNYDAATNTFGQGSVSVLLFDGSGNLLSNTVYPVGTDPQAVAVGNFNGLPSIVAANNQDGAVSVLLGDGQGGFKQAVSYPVGVQPLGVAVGNFNGYDDIVSANGYSNSVSVLLGDGQGNFTQPAAVYPVGFQPDAVVVADFTNDGRPDIAVANVSDNTVSVLTGNADGTFSTAPPSGTPVGQTPFALTTADFNHDGSLDVAAANGGDNTVSVLLGNGDGTFRPQGTYAVGNNPVAVATADFNGDGNPDLVTANYLGNSVSVLLGRGDGTFLAETSYAVGNNPQSVAVGDFNGDMDIVTANSGGNTVSVLLGNGDGAFQKKPLTYTVGYDPYAVAVGDINGHPDIITANRDYNATTGAYGPGTVSVLLFDGNGQFLYEFAYDVGTGPDAVAVGDFNGHPDVVTANADGTVSVLLFDGNGGLVSNTTYAVGSAPIAVAVGDINDDNRPDIVVANQADNTVSVLLGNGDGTFQPSFNAPAGDSPHGVAVGDFNNDGHNDFATANIGNNTVSVLLGTGGNPFQSPTSYPLGLPSQGIAFGADGLGNDAIVTANPANNKVSVLLGYKDGAAFLPPAVAYPVGNDPVAVAVGNDPTDPSILDIFAANKGANTVSALVEKADGSFGTATPYSITDANGGTGPVAVAVGVDPNYQGSGIAVDVVATADSDGRVSVLVVLPALQEYLPAVTYPVTKHPVAVVVDAYLDIFVADSDGTVTELVNDGSDNFSVGSPVYHLGAGLDAMAVGYDGANRQEYLAVANKSTNTVSVLVDNGAGADFTPVTQLPFPVGNDPDAVAVGLSPNGNVDVVAANYQGSVSVLVGNASNQFQITGPYPVGSGPTGVSVAYDNTFNLAILTANSGDNTASVLLGATVFRSASPQNGVASRNLPYLQDLNGIRDANGNPIPDEVVLDDSGDILFRPGTGTPDQFSPAAVLNPGHPARDATLFQTAHGWAVAAIDQTGNTVSIYTWDGAGFVRTVGFATGNGPVRIAAADLTGDGLYDLVVANDSDDTITIAFQTPSGQFGGLLTRPVGSAPSDIAFADIDGQGGLDIVVSDQASGDYSVLFNDPNHTFDQESRYRAGPGLFDVDDSTGQQTIVSQLLTTGVVAGSFTHAGSEDLVVLNRGAQNITLLPNQGQGSFTLPGVTYATSARPSQIVKLTLPGDPLPSVAVLMEDLHQIWIYRNNNHGGFDAPVKIDAGNDPTDFSVQTINGQLALLVGNAFGDVLTLRYDGNLNGPHGGFMPDTSNLNDTPMAVGTTADGRQFAIIADQQSDTAYLYYRINGTTQFSSRVAIPSTSQRPLLAPGAAQIFYVTGDSNPYLAFANSLGNDVLLYHYDSATSGFDLVKSISVGDDPVSITVADVNGDGVPDLLVANKGSNDVSVLIGSIPSGVWTATPYQRLNSGGLGPLAVTVQNGGANGPDLLITNSDGTVTKLTSIGAGGHGSGFFQDSNPRPINLGMPVMQSVYDPTTGQTFVVGGNGSLSLLTGDVLTPLPIEGVTELISGGDFLVAGLDNGSVAVLSTDGAVLAHAPSGFDQISALDVLQNDDTGEVDVFLATAGQDTPVVLPFFVSVVTEAPRGLATSEALVTSIPGLDLVLVATLAPDILMDDAAITVAAAPTGETFAFFVPTDGAGADDAPPDQEAAVPVAAVGGDESEVPALEQYVLGVADALEQRLKDQQLKDDVEDFLDALKAAWDQFFQEWTPPALPDPTVAAAQGPDVNAVAAVVEADGATIAVVWTPADAALARPPEFPKTPPPAPAADVFTCVELLPATAALVWPPEPHDGATRFTLNTGTVLLSTYLAWRLGVEGWRRDREERRQISRAGGV